MLALVALEPTKVAHDPLPVLQVSDAMLASDVESRNGRHPTTVAEGTC